MVLNDVVGVQKITGKDGRKWIKLNLVSCDVLNDDSQCGSVVSFEFLSENYGGEFSGIEWKNDWYDLVGKRVSILKEDNNGKTQVAVIRVCAPKK